MFLNPYLLLKPGPKEVQKFLPVLHRAHYFEESSVPCSSGAEWCKAALEGEGSASGAYVAPGSDLEC